MATVTEMPPQDAAPEADSPVESTPETTQPAPKEKSKGGRPPKGQPRIPDAKNPAFFQRVAQIAAEDWGTRAFMYVYIDEPVCIAKTWGESRYALKSSKPILDLEPLKQQFGSFKGWLSLNTRKSGKDATDQQDRLDFEILDPLCPPKIPVRAWANDARNERWRALLPPEPPSQSAAASQLLDSLKVIKEIQKDAKDEVAANAAPETNHARETLETMRIAKELFAPPAAAPATPAPAAKDPLELGISLATTFMQMKADNPMVEMLRDELKAVREELKEARTQKVEPPKGIIEQLIDLAAQKEKLEGLKSLFGGVFGGAGEVLRAPKTSALDVARELMNSPLGENVGRGLGELLANLARNGANGQNQPPQPTTINGTAKPVESDQQRIQRIAMTITNPMINEYFDREEDGGTFAEHVFNFWPEDFMFLKKIGPEMILNLYQQHSKQVWAHVAEREADFRKFVADFCAWKPEGAEDPEPPTPTGDGFEEAASA